MGFLKNAWYCAGWSSGIENSPVLRRFLDEPVLLYRTEGGEATALSDVCPHRFAPLHKGKLVGDNIECPYHGLQFNTAGACVHNPHGSGRIPQGSNVRRYPLVESQNAAWIWMGDPALADPELIPDLGMFDAEFCPWITDYLYLEVDYRLLIDNLLDLSHATYLHAGTLTPAHAKREMRFTHDGNSVKSHYLQRNIPTPGSQSLFYPGERGDYHSTMEWLLPSNFRNSLIMTDVGAPPEEGATMLNTVLLTPETETTCHYFYALTRNRQTHVPQIDETLRKMVNYAFKDEDEPMIKDCQTYMGGQDLMDLKPIYLETDESDMRARRILEKAIRDEQAGTTGRIDTPALFAAVGE
ncbi:Rieske 2Fe-2S domain-containing protein [Rhizorhapis sp. SPR117]|uniref:Rieske 2Fe-2S domain-containing protein n=1 Tax=Rhizorhapis sp. SPR117 TaxID=2912611 RepID=UPI001F20907B|nr:aromatic ring-hydroxylating dioxygenase subunit alpha [Rhizorhapis sp. SPR117]